MININNFQLGKKICFNYINASDENRLHFARVDKFISDLIRSYLDATLR